MFDGIIDAVKAFIPKLIVLLVVMVVARLIHELAGPMLGNNPDPDVIGGVIKAIAGTVSASLLTVITVAALDSAK